MRSLSSQARGCDARLRRSITTLAFAGWTTACTHCPPRFTSGLHSTSCCLALLGGTCLLLSVAEHFARPYPSPQAGRPSGNHAAAWTVAAGRRDASGFTLRGGGAGPVTRQDGWSGSRNCGTSGAKPSIASSDPVPAIKSQHAISANFSTTTKSAATRITNTVTAGIYVVIGTT